VDELYTHAVVTHPHLSGAFQAIQAGIDSMPTYALVLRVLATAAGDPSEVFFRGSAFASVVLALVGVYVLLRDSVRPLPALAAVFIIWAHPLSLIHAFDARFHGPFLAAAVWFSFAVTRRLAAPHKRWTAIGLALASLALCSIHVFGVVVWTIVLVVVALAYRGWRRYLPALAGPPVVPILWFVALAPQRKTFTVTTWEAPFSWSRVLDTAGYVLVPEYLAAAFLLMWAVFCVHRVVTREATNRPPTPFSPSLLLLSSVSLLIPALVVLSLVVQPVLTPRYSIAAIVALAPAVAYGLSRIPRWGSIVVLLALVLVSTNELRRKAAQARWQDDQTRAVMASIRALPTDGPIVFEVPHVLDVVWHYAPDLRTRLVLLDFEMGDVPDPSPIRIAARDLARAYGTVFDAPRRLPWSELQSAPAFYLAPDPRAYNKPPTADRRYPGFAVVPENAIISRATRR